MLYALALQKNAPSIFTKTNKQGVPGNAIIVSSLATFLVVPLSYFSPNWFDAFKVVVSFVVVCILVNWNLITLAHMKFKQTNKQTLFPAPFYPYSSYLTLAFILFILAGMALPQIGMVKQVVGLPIWILIAYIGYKLTKKNKDTSK
jgi:L-asparagine transporter-like permease